AEKFAAQNSMRSSVKAEASGYRDALVALDNQLGLAINSINSHRNGITSNTAQRKLVAYSALGLGIFALGTIVKSLKVGTAGGGVFLAAQTALSVTNLWNDQEIERTNIQSTLTTFDRHATAALKSGELSAQEIEKLGEIRGYLTALRDMPGLPKRRSDTSASWMQISGMLVSAVSVLLIPTTRNPQMQIFWANSALILGGGIQLIGMGAQTQDVFADDLSDEKLAELVTKIGEVRAAAQRRAGVINAELAR
ncbi:MAG: hypothetical protein ABL958_02570, partial [Bdellovibrionia bacterium]